MRKSVALLSVASLLCVGLGLVALSSCRFGHHRADAPIPPAPKDFAGDYARLQGVWVVTRNELKRRPLPEMTGSLFIFEKDRFRLGNEKTGERFAIDETSVPKRIDFDDGRAPPVLGIYQLDGDVLTICSGGPGDPRPSEFKTSMFSSAVLTRLKRR